MSDYPDYITPSTEQYCAAAGCSFTPDTVKRMTGADLATPTPRFAVQGTDLCNWHHAQFVRVLGDLVNLHPELVRASYTRGSSRDDAGSRGGGMPSDVGSSWNPHAATVLAELGDWTDYLVRTVLREEPAPAPEVRAFFRTDTVRENGHIVHNDDGSIKTIRTVHRTIVQPGHGVAIEDGTHSKLKALATWHAGWLSRYPFVGPYLLADALQHRRLGMKALQADSVKRVTLKNTVCNFVLEEDESFGEIICGADLYAILRPKDGKPSEILCSANPRHPQLSRDSWIDALPRSSK